MEWCWKNLPSIAGETVGVIVHGVTLEGVTVAAQLVRLLRSTESGCGEGCGGVDCVHYTRGNKSL